MISLTKQDIQNVMDSAKNRIMERMATRQDIQVACDASKDRVLTFINAVQAQQYQLAKQTNIQTIQLVRRVANLETRLVTIESDLRTMNILLQRLTEVMQEQRLPRDVAVRALKSQYAL